MGSKTWVRPPRLERGSRVALVAPAGPLLERDDLTRAEALCRALGYEPALGRNAAERHGYFAGTDEQRLADLNDALRDPEVSAIWCIRGGYGSTRILDRVDFDALARRPKPLIGYSDITAMLNAAAAPYRRDHLPRPDGARRDARLQPAPFRAGTRRRPSPRGASSRLPQPAGCSAAPGAPGRDHSRRDRRGAAAGRQPQPAAVPARNARTFPISTARSSSSRMWGRTSIGWIACWPTCGWRACWSAWPASPSAGSPSSTAR